jgi:hypothetical protein
MTEFETVAWERPLSAQVAHQPETVRLHRPAHTVTSLIRPAVEELEGVRDVDRHAGIVFYEDGSQSSIRTAFARLATQHSMDTQR